MLLRAVAILRKLGAGGERASGEVGNPSATADSPARQTEIHLRLFWWLMQMGQFEEAKASCRKLLDLNVVDNQDLNGIAWTLAASPDPAARDAVLAVEVAEKAVRSSPEHWYMWNTLGVARYRAGDYRRTVADLEKSVQLNNKGGHGTDFFFVAMAHHRLGNPQAASQWYEKGVRWMDQTRDSGLSRLRAEAEELLGVTARPASQPATAPSDGK